MSTTYAPAGGWKKVGVTSYGMYELMLIYSFLFATRRRVLVTAKNTTVYAIALNNLLVKPTILIVRKQLRASNTLSTVSADNQRVNVKVKFTELDK